MRLSDAYPSNFLKADDLRGSPVTVTISSVDLEELGQGKDKEKKLVIGFHGKEKKLVCNKTNAGTIAKLYGDETDGWLGQRITMMPREVEYAGEMVLAIRVSLQKPAAVNSPAPRPQGPRTPEPAPAEYGHEQVSAPPDDENSGVPF